MHINAFGKAKEGF